MRAVLRVLALASLATLAACVSRPVPAPVTPPAPQPAPTQPAPAPGPTPTPPPVTATNARAAGVTLSAPRALPREQAVRALDAFRISCPVLIRRQDRSGLATGEDWRAVCTEAASLPLPGIQGRIVVRFDD